MKEIRLGSKRLQPGRQLLANDRRVPLGRRALDILSALAEAKGAIVTKDELLEAVWQGVVVEENALQVHIAALRKALGPEADRLRTIRGVGYQLEVDAPRPVGASVDRGSHERIPLVVEPLATNGNDGGSEAALARGITDELIVRLRRIPDLKVGSAGPPGSPLSEMFRNAFVVAGTVHSNGERLQITARLVSPDGEVAWSRTLDRRLVDLLDMQEEIAYSIGNELSIPLAFGHNAIEYGGTDNPEAFAAYVQSAAHFFDPDQSIPLRYLERAIELDPRFIKALAALTLNYGMRIAMFASPAEADALFAGMDACSAQARSANSGSAFGHAARGFYYIARKDLPAARRHAFQAAQLDDGKDPELRVYLATFALWFGRIEEAAAIRKSNEEIDPAYRVEPWYVFDLMMLGKYQAAVDHFARVERDTPLNVQPFIFHAFFAYLLMGREDDAMAFSDQHDPILGQGLRAFRADRALRVMPLPELKHWAKERYRHNQFEIAGAALYAGLDGHDDLAVDLMRLALESPGGNALLLLWHPALARARETAAFAQLAADLGFDDTWREDGGRGNVVRRFGKGDAASSEGR